MVVFALSFGYFGPTLPTWEAAVLWVVFASIVGGLWSLVEHWLQRRAGRVSWDTLCYSWPTAMTLAWPLLVLAELGGGSRGSWSQALELLTAGFIAVNVPAMIVSLLFLFSPLCVALIWIISRVAGPDWSLVLIAGPVFWATWFGMLRRIEDRWTYEILSIRTK